MRKAVINTTVQGCINSAFTIRQMSHFVKLSTGAMQLKDYQQRTLDQIKAYLDLLTKERTAGNIKHASEDAWNALGLKEYKKKQNGMGRDVPNFCLKIPTGGGKTFLAVKTIDLINTMYRKKKTGLILWVVPTTQIYNQTILALRDRAHPYRQHLDIASGGRTVIKEKMDHFSPQDVTENLVVLMLMLPSANRKNSKETLRVFRDNGGFQSFFPEEDKIKEHEELLRRIPNLDTFGEKEGFWGQQVMTSLGNTLRLLQPVIILDETHKAYSEQAQATLRGFNPAMIVELSATPPPGSNVLVNISGIELNREEMIKLDLHVTNKTATDWKETLLAAISQREVLQKKAERYEASTGNYIRPICLIQVERVGRDQRDGGHIHAEEVREWLIKMHGVPPDQVAVKTSEVDELDQVDLLSKDCPVRYIITKYALQEGWDCAFAYVLAILNHTTGERALTQLIGRILRQPYARKTNVPELDESYVFTYHLGTGAVLESIKKGFVGEGLGDLRNSIVSDSPDLRDETGEPVTYAVRERFRQAAKRIILPVFVAQDAHGWRPVNYEMDIARRIDWQEADMAKFALLTLGEQSEGSVEVVLGLSDDARRVIEEHTREHAAEIGIAPDMAFLTRHLVDIVGNPWNACAIGHAALAALRKRYRGEVIAGNFIFIIDELRKHLLREQDRLAKQAFDALMGKGDLRFMLIAKDLGFNRLPKEITMKSNVVRLNREDGTSLQRSLFDAVPADEYNDELEKPVAWYLDGQDRLFFWYRNQSRQDYYIQGWRKNKIYPDFIFTDADEKKKDDFQSVFVVETKGIHLKGEDTEYKKSILDICNEQAREKSVDELPLALRDKNMRFEVIFGDEWKAKLNELMYTK